VLGPTFELPQQSHQTNPKEAQSPQKSSPKQHHPSSSLPYKFSQNCCFEQKMMKKEEEAGAKREQQLVADLIFSDAPRNKQSSCKKSKKSNSEIS
jgi:hypothetical protein